APPPRPMAAPAPRPAPAPVAQPPRAASGFDDMDDDIPF
ncbi:MAG TPA: single-stranded DNA-binding protein, partial [Acidovorax temperans]|nr:single-stranded DNA-binding protein [Acidovorax temperans]